VRLLSFDRSHGSDWFHGLTADDVTVHENQVDQLLRDMALPAPVAERAYRWYLEQRWQPEAVLAAHRPYQGVLDVIRWFQIQPDTSDVTDHVPHVQDRAVDVEDDQQLILGILAAEAAVVGGEPPHPVAQ